MCQFLVVDRDCRGGVVLGGPEGVFSLIVRIFIVS